MRAGADALSLLSIPLNVHVLSVLQDESKPLTDLRRDVGLPPQTTMRGQLRTLTRTRVLDRQQEAGFPGAVNYALAPAGVDLLAVARALRRWLARSPNGPLAFGSVEAKSVLKALAEAWSSAIVRALASGPLSLTDLNRLIAGLNYPSLERRLGTLRAAGMIEPSPSRAQTTPYRATRWLREAIAPLAAAARWERRHAPAVTTPIGRIDIEASLLLTLPLLQLPAGVSGDCQLAVEARAGESRMIGVTARFSEGSVESCVGRLEGDADAGACGTAMAWIDAVERDDPGRLEIRGDRDLVSAILRGLHDALVKGPTAASPRPASVAAGSPATGSRSPRP